MTEEKWLESRSPSAMLKSLGPEVSQRKLRLLVAGCLRGAWPLLVVEASRAAVETAERFADGEASGRQLARARVSANAASRCGVRSVSNLNYHEGCAVNDARGFCRADIREAARDIFCASGIGPCPPNAARLFRCVFGNPFRPVAFSPAWRTSDVTALAIAAYEQRILPSGKLDPHCLAVLADALEEIGAAAEVVEHLRAPGPHVRGCWALDLCLGKS